MTAALRDSLHKLLVGVVHLWFTQSHLEHEEPSRITFYVYPKHLEWGQDLLRGRRVRVTISVEEDPS